MVKLLEPIMLLVMAGMIAADRRRAAAAGVQDGQRGGLIGRDFRFSLSVLFWKMNEQ